MFYFFKFLESYIILKEGKKLLSKSCNLNTKRVIIQYMFIEILVIITQKKLDSSLPKHL